MAASPTPPQPMTATVSPRPTPPVLTAAPMPGHHPAAEQPRRLGPRRRVDLRRLAGGDQGLLGEGADAQGGRQRRAVRQGHRLVGVAGVEAVPGPAAPAGPALPAHGAASSRIT